MAEAGEDSVDLGFAEKCEDDFRMLGISYPSKLGGKPAWLRWDSLLTESQARCNNCDTILHFLCQIYVPTDIEEKHYHRTLYVFCCSNGKCYSSKKQCVKVFRSLQEESEDDLTEDDLDKKAEEELRKMFETIISTKNKFLFDEYEIVIEEEPKKKENSKNNNIGGIDESRLKELMSDGKQDLDKELEKEFNKATANTRDEYFEKFKKRINREPDQIIRYDLGGIPLWVSSEKIPFDKDIPKCSCGSKRQYEFQILPQMLNYLGIETTVDSIDWGTLCIYTCINNCNESAYHEEFVWKQDFSFINI
ncbi:programmed cell death protein 2-like isoform X2 [Clytia hemisphaerica]|uniref:programmed cell death protein 2-like isoform X2 n=1 Tax=Clytia hemisphaerica TaxID=252671 RepID=UPI0034D45C9C